ncbi:MAG: vitamin K epoxide reductase family protein, partial [Candidatus Nanopelagicales bacterium]|nr:vitamin K epoxide reductase family protein [Candidatus Nanopelagicales bacterium]
MTITDDLDAKPVYVRRHTWAYTEMLISSLLGLVASLVLSIDAVALAANPDVDLSCNINEKISCGAVGLTWQANLLGFPNAFLGLIAEPVVITVATAALGGVRFPRWFMITAQVIYSIGLAFAYWLFYEAYFVIGALCPWCLLITVTTTLVFMSMTRVNLLDGNLGVRLQEWSRKPLSYGADIA